LPPGLKASAVRHARWIVEGRLHPATMADIPMDVRSWVDPVAACLAAIRNGQ